VVDDEKVFLFDFGGKVQEIDEVAVDAFFLPCTHTHTHTHTHTYAPIQPSHACTHTHHAYILMCPARIGNTTPPHMRKTERGGLWVLGCVRAGVCMCVCVRACGCVCVCVCGWVGAWAVC